MLLLLWGSWVQAQLIQDEASQQLSEKILNDIYNFQFQAAQQKIQQLEKKYKKHPVVPFLKGYQLSWQNYPLEQPQKEYTHFNQYLQLSALYADHILDRDKDNLEGIFFKMMVYGLLAMHEAESGTFSESVAFGKKSFSYMKKGFDLTNQYPDFHFSTGLYRYFAEQYPETNPMAKPFMIFFPGGNKKEGLQHLQAAVQKGRFSKVEALIYLNDIYSRYEQNYLQALHYAQQLINRHPANPFFRMRYIEALILVGRYAEAEQHLAHIKSRSENMYRKASVVFQGMIAEKYYKNLSKAKTHYQQVVKNEVYDQRYTKEYQAFAYAGLARIAQKAKDDKAAKDYYKKALKLAEYEWVKAEAETYLKG